MRISVSINAPPSTYSLLLFIQEQGRTEIANSFQLLKKVFNRKADSYFLKVLIFTKIDEIVKIFSEAPTLQKTLVYNILKEIDPTNPKIDKITERQN